MRSRALLPILLAAALPAAASTLYKSVNADGTLMFSDVPPPSGSRILEEREITPPNAVASNGYPATSPSFGAPSTSLDQVYGIMDSDAALAQANASVDQAEHALALARNGAASRFEGLRLDAARSTEADSARIDFYKRDLRVARRALVDLVNERQQASREPGAPRVVASNASGSLLGAVR